MSRLSTGELKRELDYITEAMIVADRLKDLLTIDNLRTGFPALDALGDIIDKAKPPRRLKRVHAELLRLLETMRQISLGAATLEEGKQVALAMKREVDKLLL